MELSEVEVDGIKVVLKPPAGRPKDEGSKTSVNPLFSDRYTGGPEEQEPKKVDRPEEPVIRGHRQTARQDFMKRLNDVNGKG